MQTVIIYRYEIQIYTFFGSLVPDATPEAEPDVDRSNSLFILPSYSARRFIPAVVVRVPLLRVRGGRGVNSLPRKEGE